MKIVVTDTDMKMASDALIAGWDTCKARNGIGRPKACDCDLGAVDGCKTVVSRIALAIATARKL